jgi:hypothetical protein
MCIFGVLTIGISGIFFLVVAISVEQGASPGLYALPIVVFLFGVALIKGDSASTRNAAAKGDCPTCLGAGATSYGTCGRCGGTGRA